MESLRKKLTSPSTMFKSNNGTTELVRPITPPSPTAGGANGHGNLQEGVQTNGTSGSGRGSGENERLERYSAMTPRTPTTGGDRRGSGQFASPTLFPEHFSLSRTRSPEHTSPNGNANNKRNSWTPSYPLVIPHDQYAEVAPDGQAPPSAVLSAPVPTVDENSHRRSGNFTGSKPSAEEEIASWPAMQPDMPAGGVKKTGEVKAAIRPTATLENGLWTPPSSAEAVPVTSPFKASTDTAATTPANQAASPTSPGSPNQAVSPRSPGSPSRPPLNILTSPTSPGRPLDSADISSPTSTNPTPTPLSTSATASPTTSPPLSGIAAKGSPAIRPGGPSRRTTLITSPPMPQPIKNLPTMAGWPGFNLAQASGSSTPGWGALAREGGPKTPGGMFGQMPRTPGAFGQTPRTPGAGATGFPFATQLPKQKAQGPMTEEELRKMRRAMVSSDSN